jgi:transcriptional regulator with XRE-family HTH domain
MMYASFMQIGQRLREIREAKNLSQGDIAEGTGLVRPYISRVENGHTIPGLETLEKWARALNMPLYQILYEGEEPPKPLKVQGTVDEELWGNSRKEAAALNRLRLALKKMDEDARKVLLSLATRMATRSRRATAAAKKSS